MNRPVAVPTRAELLRQYEISIDLYKHYLKLALELNVFYYAITGAIVSYFLANRTTPLMEYALYLPLLMSVMFAVLFAYGGVLDRATELKVLTYFLFILAVLMTVTAIGLIVLICGS